MQIRLYVGFSLSSRAGCFNVESVLFTDSGRTSKMGIATVLTRANESTQPRARLSESSVGVDLSCTTFAVLSARCRAAAAPEERLCVYLYAMCVRR